MAKQARVRDAYHRILKGSRTYRWLNRTYWTLILGSDLFRLSAPHLTPYPATQPYESIDSAGKITILGSGKATTRAKRRITAALRVLSLRTASPRGHSEETVLLP